MQEVNRLQIYGNIYLYTRLFAVESHITDYKMSQLSIKHGVVFSLLNKTKLHFATLNPQEVKSNRSHLHNF
jgi:hypothetical protein